MIAGIQRLELGHAEVGNAAGAVGGAVHRGIVHQHQTPVAALVHVHLFAQDRVPLLAQFLDQSQSGSHGRQRVAGPKQIAALMGDDDGRRQREVLGRRRHPGRGGPEADDDRKDDANQQPVPRLAAHAPERPLSGTTLLGTF